MTKAIWLDMDGTIADLYACDKWLEYLRAEKTKPYREARPLVDMRRLGRELNRLQAGGYTIGVISWGSKDGSVEYLNRVAETKKRWLARHLGAVQFDEIAIVEYGTPKSTCGRGILFDDEEKNRIEWGNGAYNVDNIIGVLQTL